MRWTPQLVPNTHTRKTPPTNDHSHSKECLTGGGGAAPFFPLRTISPSVASTSVFLLTRVPSERRRERRPDPSALSSGSGLRFAGADARWEFAQSEAPHPIKSGAAQSIEEDHMIVRETLAANFES